MDRVCYSSRVDQFLEEKVKSRTNSLFKSRNEVPQLVVYLLSWSKEPCGRRTLQTQQPIQINHVPELRRLQKEKTAACTQAYTVTQLRSWTTLNISSELFRHLLEAQSVFPHFWKSVLTFGVRFVENEYGFPPFRSKSSQRVGSKIEEIAYVIRRVELNQRPTSKLECPWSIRQTAVYHRLTYPHDGSPCSSVFILVAPSRAVENEVSQCLPGSPSEGEIMKPHFSIHESLIADSLRNWMDYMTWLESECNQMAHRQIAWNVNNGDEHMIYFNVDDRQRLKQLGDYITDLIVVLQTAVNTIGRIGKSCQQHCQMSCRVQDDCCCSSMIREFSEYDAEAHVYLERAKVLQERVQSTEQLLTDLLGFEDTRALKELARTSQTESHYVAELAKRSAEDAAAVKMLSLVGLVYLPTTIVANFFSTQFVKVDDQGGIYISSWVWILAVISIPLTVATIFLWILSVRYSDSPWFLKVTRIRPRPLSHREEVDLEQGRLQGRTESMPLSSLMRPSMYCTSSRATTTHPTTTTMKAD